MTNTLEICPRSSESFAFQGHDGGKCNWNKREDGHCDYCGSLNPAVLMARLEAGTVKLGATDKSYKVYVTNVGGEDFKQTYRDCYLKDLKGCMVFDENRQALKKDPPCHGPEDCQHWVTRPRATTKFYFQHLSREQQQRFVDLYNENKLKFDGGGFYTWPYFMGPAK